MEENKKIERKVIKISKKKLIWGFVILVIVLVGGWFVLSLLTSSYGVESLSKGSFEDSRRISEEGMPFVPSVSTNNYVDYRPQNQDPSIADTREFMKTNYNSTIKTRDVSDTIKEVKNIVKGADGRVDEFNTSEKYGRIGFVVAKSKFDDFRDEIENITHKKLYTENISSDNLLGQKQGIENQILNVTQSLNSLISQKTELNDTHTKTVTTINKELSRINNELIKVRAIISAESDPQILVSLRSQETNWVGQQSSQKKKLNDENSVYASKLQNLDAMINNAQNNLTQINKTDTNFTDNIETVNGYVSATRVSIWELGVIFSPIHPVLIIIILIIGGIVLFRRRIPRVVVE